MDPTENISSWLGTPPRTQDDAINTPSKVMDSDDQDAEAAGKTAEDIATHLPVSSSRKRDNAGDQNEDAAAQTPFTDADFNDDISVEDDESSDELASWTKAIQIRPGRETRSSKNDTLNGNSLPRTPFRRQPGLSVNVPQLEEEESETFEYLPGHFEVRKVLWALDGNKYLVKLASGEIDSVNTTQLSTQLLNGKAAMQKYRLKRATSQRPRQATQPLKANGMVDWDALHIPDIDSSEDQDERPSRHSRWRSTYTSDDDTQDDFSAAVTRNRRSIRSSRARPLSYATADLLDLIDDEGESETRKRRKRQHTSGRASPRLDAEATRRSERTRRQPRTSMREKQEDEFSSQSEKGQGPKVVGAREVFEQLSEQDPFRRRHQHECATCYHQGDLNSKGPLIFCQGCTQAYHKSCLGPRSSRDHLVTKVADDLFVLQCRRCIGVARERDRTAPHHGKCTACDKFGNMSRPLRKRLTSRQEQLQREENGGIDPITIVQPGTMNNIKNVMFRCATCNRAWHMHHLPTRKTATSRPEESDEEGLIDAQKAQKRFDLYHRSWTCKDCVEFQNPIDNLVAWRPSDQKSYVPGTTLSQLQESQKEYLVKWRNQSYMRCDWMPGTWVWGSIAAASRVAFGKKPEHQLPRMTTKDAIPEEYHRVDIVFDVKYTSVVRNSSEQIDYVRVKEVDSAFVKYQGLGYEDAIWEKPPSYAETGRWEDFKSAYEDFVKKSYMSIPPQSTLRRRVADARLQDFGTKLIKKTQTAIMTGGEMMQYQLEGHNWLYYQWYRQHNAILADEMGLGKTIQLIALMGTLIHDHKCWPFLIVVPNSTCPNWRREIKKWIPSIRAVCYYGSAQARKLIHDYELFPKDKDEADDPPPKKNRSEPKNLRAHIVIASYESVTEEKTRQSLMRVPWQGLIVDEGQRLKNDKNLVYDALSKFNFPFKVLMTGTPLQNNARELFNLLQFLDREKHNAAELEAKYAELTHENVPELHDMLKPYFLRRTKAQVLTFLPPMSQVIVPVSMSALQKKVYKSILAQNPQLMRSLFSRTGNVAVKDRANLNNMLMQLRKTLCHPFVYSREIEDREADSDTSFKTLVEASSKLQLLSIMLPRLRERGHRVLLFSQFLDNLDIVEDFLDGMGMLHRRLDGSINALEKQKRIDDFNAVGSPYFAFLLSTRAGGVGINLATADTVIILDPDFNPHQDIQALSRAHRIGQHKKVLVFQLMTRASVEEKIMQIGKKKMALDHVLIESMDQGDEAGVDLESILRHGAEALFADEGDEDIIYNEASVDRLLDRSQMESTKTSEKQSAESQFSFARIWANDKAGLEDDFEESRTGTPDPGIWDKILQERERAYKEETARKAAELGRGKRKRGHVDYRSKGNGEREPAHQDNLESGDEDFEEDHTESDEDITTEGDVTEPEISTVRARPFQRVKVPGGHAPHFNGDGHPTWASIPIPSVHHCMACKEHHPMGWCRLKIAGVEHCGLCGLAHMGHGRTCPHLNDEKQVETLLLTLKESIEPRELVDEAVKYLRIIRSDLVSQRRARERMAQQQQLPPPPPLPPQHAPQQQTIIPSAHSVAGSEAAYGEGMGTPRPLLPPPPTTSSSSVPPHWQAPQLTQK